MAIRELRHSARPMAWEVGSSAEAISVHCRAFTVKRLTWGAKMAREEDSHLMLALCNARRCGRGNIEARELKLTE